MDDALVVALFRHGLTEENKRHAYLGWTDAPLCGEVVGRLSQKRFVANSYEWLVSSDLRRCLQTARLLFPNQEPYVMQEFREINFGLWEGKTYDELTGDPQYEQWLASWCTTEIPEGESSLAFDARIESGWQKVQGIMLNKNIKRTAIVSHGGVIRSLLTKLGQGERKFWDWKIPHGTGFELVWENQEAFRRGERCTLLREALLTENLPG